jgi:drug/metabolite transporter (DMT)-like permease
MFNVLLFSALKTITAIRSSIMLAFTPVVVAIAALILFKEIINKIMSVGILISIIGVIITVTSGDVSQVISNGLSIGDVYMILAVLSWAFYSIVIKSAIARISPLTALSYGALIGIVMLLPFTFIEQGWSTLSNLTLGASISLLYLGFFAAGVAYLWYFQGIKEVGSSRSSVFLNVEPVAAIFIGVVFLKEVLTLPLFIGALLVMGGLFLTTYKPKTKMELLR